MLLDKTLIWLCFGLFRACRAGAGFTFSHRITRARSGKGVHSHSSSKFSSSLLYMIFLPIFFGQNLVHLPHLRILLKAKEQSGGRADVRQTKKKRHRTNKNCEKVLTANKKRVIIELGGWGKVSKCGTEVFGMSL